MKRDAILNEIKNLHCRSIAATGSWDGQRLRPSDIVMHSTQPEARATATLTMYRVRQKSKLLILSEYVNKSETIRGMSTNTNSHRENGALSYIFA